MIGIVMDGSYTVVSWLQRMLRRRPIVTAGNDPLKHPQQSPMLNELARNDGQLIEGMWSESAEFPPHTHHPFFLHPLRYWMTH